MTEYRRVCLPGRTWFFTVNLAERRENRLLIDRIDLLRTAFRTVQMRHPFELDAVVILPDHLHCIWTLPPADMDFAGRWSLIKSRFSRGIEKGEWITQSRVGRGECGIWQRRCWEHLIRDDEDFSRHVDYIHWDPVKHGCVRRVADWPYSSFHQFVKSGLHAAEWSDGDPVTIEGAELRDRCGSPAQAVSPHPMTLRTGHPTR